MIYRERPLSQRDWAFLIAVLLALLLVAVTSAQTQVPDYDICKDIEPYTFWWYAYFCNW